MVFKIYSSKVSCGSKKTPWFFNLPRMQGKDFPLVEYSKTRELANNYLVPKIICLALSGSKSKKIIKAPIA